MELNQVLLIVLVVLVICCCVKSMMSTESFEGTPEEQLTLDNVENPTENDFTNQNINIDSSSLSEYNQELIGGLDEEITKSHENYVNDSDFLATTGASNNTERDDFNPPVKFHGLPRCAHYAQLGAQSDSRTQQSETVEDLALIKGSCPNRYCL